MPTQKSNITYHFDVVYDDTERKWFVRTDFEGLPLQEIYDGVKWRHPTMSSEKIKLLRRRDELMQALNKLSGFDEEPPTLTMIKGENDG